MQGRHQGRLADRTRGAAASGGRGVRGRGEILPARPPRRRDAHAPGAGQALQAHCLKKKQGAPERAPCQPAQLRLLVIVQNAHAAGSAVVRHRAAGPRVDDLLERLARAHDTLELPPRGLVTAGVRDEDAMAVDVVAALEPLLDVLHVALFELAAVLVADAHLAVLDLDARLEVQEVGAHGHERRAAAAALEILQRVDHEADIELLALFLQRRCDVGRVHALLGHLGRVEHQVARY